MKLIAALVALGSQQAAAFDKADILKRTALVVTRGDLAGSSAQPKGLAGVFVTARHVVEACDPLPKQRLQDCPELDLVATTGRRVLHSSRFWRVGLLSDDLAVIIGTNEVSFKFIVRKVHASTPNVLAKGQLLCAGFAASIVASAEDRQTQTDYLRSQLGQIYSQMRRVRNIGPVLQNALKPVLRSIAVATPGAKTAPPQEQALAAAVREFIDQGPDAWIPVVRNADHISPVPNWPGAVLITSLAHVAQIEGTRWKTDCDGWQGTSGGGVFDQAGHLVAITQGFNDALGTYFRPYGRIGLLNHVPLAI